MTKAPNLKRLSFGKLEFGAWDFLDKGVESDLNESFSD